MVQAELFASDDERHPIETDRARTIGQIAAAGRRRNGGDKAASDAAVDQGWGNEAAVTATPEDIFITKGYRWTPHSRGEVSIAIHGLRDKLNKAYRAKDRLAAFESTLKTAEGFLSGAHQEKALLRAALRDKEDSSSFDTELALSDVGVMQVVSRHQVYASALNQGKWPNKTNIDAKAAEVYEQLTGADSDPEALELLWHGADESASQRIAFWEKQHEAIKTMPQVEQLERERMQRVRQ